MSNEPLYTVGLPTVEENPPRERSAAFKASVQLLEALGYDDVNLVKNVKISNDGVEVSAFGIRESTGGKDYRQTITTHFPMWDYIYAQ